MSHNVGGALAPIIASGVIASTGNWRMAFYVPAVIAIAMGVGAIIFMRDRPSKYGLPSVGEWKQDALEKQQEAQSESGLTGKEIFIKYILKNPLIWLAVGGDLCIYMVRTIITDWPAVYYTQVAHWDLVTASSLSAWFEVGGIVGGLSAGFISDLFFKSNRWTSCLLFSLMLTASVALLPFFQHSSYLISAMLFALIGAGIYGPQLLFSLGIIESTHKDAAGSATGVKGLVTYIGAASAGLPVALVQQSFSWGGVFVLMMLVNVLLIISLLWLQGASRRKSRVSYQGVSQSQVLS